MRLMLVVIVLMILVLDTGASEEPTGWSPVDKQGVSRYSAIGLFFDADDGKLQTTQGTVKKDSRNPLFGQDKLWETRIDNGYPNVVYDPTYQDAPWRLWYGNIGPDGGQYLLFANSSDGLRWTKPDLGRYDLAENWSGDPEVAKLGKHNNIVMFGGGLGIYRDLHETNASVRYKISGGAPAGCYSADGSKNCVIGTAGSFDGISNWQDVRVLNFASPWRPDCHTNIIFDEPLGTYLMTTRDYENPQGREISIARTTTDFDSWSKPVVTMRGTKEHQLYSQITWRFYDVFLGIVMTYDAEDPAGHVHCMLSWSRDSVQWEWIDRDGGLDALKEFVPAGESDAFDSHVCFAAHLPLRMPDGTSRIYFMGGDGPHSGARNSSFALATMRTDRFAGIRAKLSSGSVETIAQRFVNITSAQMIVTVDVEMNGSFSIGIIADGYPSLVRSTPIVSNGTDISVTFPDGATLDPLVGTQQKLKIYIDRATVFTIGFR